MTQGHCTAQKVTDKVVMGEEICFSHWLTAAMGDFSGVLVMMRLAWSRGQWHKLAGTSFNCELKFTQKTKSKRPTKQWRSLKLWVHGMAKVDGDAHNARIIVVQLDNLFP